MLQVVLVCAIVILLLVVLIPVGLAFYSHLKTRVPPPAAPNTTAVKPPDPSPPPVAPSPPASAPAAGKTQFDTLKTPPIEAPGASATEGVQWYGMLHCTHGPLAGQRFVVPEEGFWIGRDPMLSQVVIDDARISKRHVRIVPRSGRAHAIDTESSNGTFLEKTGERITDVELKRGNTIILAENVAAFVYQI